MGPGCCFGRKCDEPNDGFGLFECSTSKGVKSRAVADRNSSVCNGGVAEGKLSAEVTADAAELESAAWVYDAKEA